MILRASLSTAFALMASSAMAVCPQAGDLTTGVVLTFGDDLREVYRQSENGFVTVEGFDGSEMSHRLELLQGLYLSQYIGIEDGEEIEESLSTYSYPLGEARPLVPVVGETWEGTVSLNESGQVREEIQRHRYEVPFEKQIGECSLLVIPVVIIYGEGDAYREVVHFLPELGMGYLFAYANNGGDLQEQILTAIGVIE